MFEVMVTVLMEVQTEQQNNETTVLNTTDNIIIVSVHHLHFWTIIPRHQLVEPVDLVVGDAFQNPCEPYLRIDLVQLGGFDQGEGDGHGIAAAL